MLGKRGVLELRLPPYPVVLKLPLVLLEGGLELFFQNLDTVGQMLLNLSHQACIVSCNMRTRLLCLAIATCLAVVPLMAQTGSATVQGAVTDPSGAVVPNADVILTQVDTSVAQKTKTNDAGLYVFPASPIGAYTLTVTSGGMETWEGRIVLQAGLAAEVNVTLKVGATSTQVTVGDVTPMVDTSTPTISERLDRARIEQFPVNDAMGLVAVDDAGVRRRRLRASRLRLAQ